MNIAIVEDDTALARVLGIWLREAGHSAFEYTTSADLLVAMNNCAFHMYVLDWNLPGRSGVDLMVQLRRRNLITEPILIITGRDHEDDISYALSAGADDYMVKPIGRRELVARIGVLARRNLLTTSPNALQIGHYTFNVSARTVLVKDRIVNLTSTEFDLAVHFFRQPGALISRNEIYLLVFGKPQELVTSSRALDTHISNMRKKLDLNKNSEVKLTSVYSLGYRLEVGGVTTQ